jgi:coat protein Gp5
MMAIPKLVAADVLPAVVGALVMGNLVNRDYEATLAQAGDVVNVPIGPNLSANNIAETGTVTNQSKSLGNAQITLNRHVESSFAIPDVTQVFTRPDLVRTYMDGAVKAIAEQIETDILAVFGQINYNTSVGSANTALTEAVIDSAESALFTAKVPGNMPRFLVTSATAYGQLRQIGRFTEMQTIGVGGVMNPILTGQILQVKGVNVFRSQFVSKVSTTTNNILFTRDAIALVMRKLPINPPGLGVTQMYQEYGNFGMRITMSYGASQMQVNFTVDALYGVGVLRNNFGQLVLS